MDREHLCSACGHASHRWFGRCPECGAWSTAGSASDTPELAVQLLASATESAERWGTGIGELDRVLGGGIVQGGVLLLAGEPGIGKSTLILQMIDAVQRQGRKALLFTGEESLSQVALRARRLGIGTDIGCAATTSVSAVISTSQRERPDVLVVDSIQTLQRDDVEQGAGSTAQVRDCAALLVNHAKASGTAVVIVGHVTKEGSVAGPKTLEHMVDAVVTLDGERTGAVRLLRAVKNRFGACDETGVFSMTEHGLEAVPDPSALLLEDRSQGAPGSVIFPMLEGTRPVLVEIQALLTPSDLTQPRRVVNGIEPRRLAMLLGVMTQRLRKDLPKKDVFLTAAGGISVKEPAADLAIWVALHSALEGRVIDPHTIAVGEVGLMGEVRRSPGIKRRLQEAQRLGFTTAIVPRGCEVKVGGLRVLCVRDVLDASDGAMRHVAAA